MDNILYFISLPETKKENLTVSILDSLVGNKNLCWCIVQAKGLSGGIALGINVDVYEFLESELGEFYIRIVIKDKMSGFTWNLVSIYGEPHAKR
jgi:hypothetical protein